MVGGGGCLFPVENEGKGEWGVEHGGWSGDRRRNWQVNARVCQNCPLANYPLVSPWLLDSDVFRLCFEIPL